MKTVSLRTFEDNLDQHAQQALAKHLPLKVTNPEGDDFVVVSAAEWSQHQETLHVLQSMDLMRQIATSLETYQQSQG
ncbi:antitoxin YefM [Halopseudomonas pachastrellae]|uniref:type II toxin-antitoxin system Phd/YefM family antitoxin n=1 Tax=Halopseudomonas pachastrellae TaxID=254161 RepID=UPI0008EAA7BA|nr:type II toxin-antitoxin system Phd/YefM family antitoxin [Halopseudomonas pachastrellae]SFM50656.1 antitoxin YefM [Halopseudomonas pachastrellae]